MGQLRQALSTIQAQLTRLTASQKLLMGSLAFIMLMALFVVSQYAGGPAMVALLPGATPEQQQRAIELLQINNIRHRAVNGQVMVPLESKHFALAQLSQSGAMPPDSSLLFSNLADKQSWAMSSDQRRQMERLALQNELALTISEFDGVRSAKVLIDVPEPIGLGAAARRPSASATVFTESGQPISQRTVDAVAGLIAGARSGLTVSDVRVIDGSSNTQRRPTSDDEIFASTNFENTQKVEKRVRDKLLELLSYIDGVIVAVNAQVDTRRVSTETRRILPNGAGSQTFTTRESTSDETQTSSSRPAEAGARPNTGLDLNRGSANGTQLTRNESESELRPEVGFEQQHVVDPRGVVTKLNATINIPRSYFIARHRERNAADAAGAEPTDTDLQPTIDEEIQRIRNDVEPQIDTMDTAEGPGAVVVSMIPDWSPVSAAAAGEGLLGIGGGPFASTGLIRTVGLGALALVSLGLMARTLKKASRPLELPTAEELLGESPVPRLNPEMIGEASEADSALAGIELSDSEIERRKMLEQITILVQDKPKEAATILGKWIQSDI